eukprot:6780464-Lingulodinium_polyedra.AAC.1
MPASGLSTYASFTDRLQHRFWPRQRVGVRRPTHAASPNGVLSAGCWSPSLCDPIFEVCRAGAVARAFVDDAR